MTAPHLLFDFFGTLAEYDPGRTTQGFPRTHALVPELSYERFAAELEAVYLEFEESSRAGWREFSMGEAVAVFLRRIGSTADPVAFERTYLAEWSAPVRPVPGLEAFLLGLRPRHRLAVVSNTHSPVMVPELLRRWGVAGLFDAVVLSVEVGVCKPHPAIYAAARAALDDGPALFVGDSYEADYRGPEAAGIPAYLIDPGGTAAVPAARRLPSVTALAAVLATT